jgi:hypothetical protein
MTDARINHLKAGQSIELSRVGSVRVVAERSGDGSRLRIVRETATGFTVVRNVAF